MKLLILLLIAAPSQAAESLPWMNQAKHAEKATTDRYGGPPTTPPPFATQPPKPSSSAMTAPSAKPMAPPLPQTASAPASHSASPTFTQRLTALNLALSATVIDEPERWSFDRLETEARALETLASNPGERAEALALRNRLDRFASIATRLRRAEPQASADGWRSPRQGTITDSSRVAPPVRLTKTSPNSRHDAEGTLRPVVSKRPNAPKYAVVDADGKIAALVTPTAGTEKQLDSMLGKRVGLTGRRGYLTDLRREHVVAERVTPLETVRR